MKKIQLGGHRYKNRPIRGYALVDDSDFGKLSKHEWSSTNHRGISYAARTLKNKRTIYMHSFLMGTPKGMCTDHIDGNSLNNQRLNLRICTNAENLRNRGKTKNNELGFKGVSFHRKTQKYRARIHKDYKEIHLGLFSTKEEAYKAYVIAANKYHAEFAKV
jgi:hypothetical protein